MNISLQRKKGSQSLPDLSKALPEKGLKRSDSTVKLDALPEFLADNEFLLDGHRPELNSIPECVKSAFFLHTETCNIWTHFAGCVGVVILAIHYLLTESQNWHQSLSFAVFFAGAFICMGCSTVYHTLICHSEPYARFWAKMDYCGIVVLIVASFAPWVHFGFYCDSSNLKLFYLGSAFLCGMAAMFVVAADRFRGGEYRVLRAVVFIVLGLTGLGPGLHYIFSHDMWPHFYFYSWLIIMAVLYISGGIIYAVRIPERLWPGKFDIWCQSHQILHICVMLGVLTCYHGASKLAHYRIEVLNECPDI
ncbi:hypothetical protein CAPTEDRAFT_103195 [Capitella teleta]|uniref:Uncharacterized protein n=1 Tax=Capitella teleta TaxID=283909 RepID=R7TJ87_CAPTE|nr:hypothetical protein CAPTEDRAFT_103195 [Capitella teleta]|eukprot:ELT93769.1 hypothetical protein CAPTEDRAFT_103195 [Capitella teleta]